MTFRRTWWLFALFFICLASLLPHLASLAGAAAPNSPAAQLTAIPPELARKIEPALLKQMAGDKNATIPFIAQFETTADVRAPESANRLDKRRSVVTQLQAQAGRTQANVLALLGARRAEHIRAFWSIDAVAARAD